MSNSIDSLKIKYFPHSDLMHPYMCQKVIDFCEENKTQLINNSLEFNDINNIFELSSVIEYFEKSEFFNNKNLHTCDIFQSIDKSVLIQNKKKMVRDCLSKITEGGIHLIEIIKSVHREYRYEVIPFLVTYNNALNHLISKEVIDYLCDNSYLYYILENRTFRNKTATFLKDYLFEHPETISLFLHKNLITANAEPFNFTPKEINGLVENYIHIPQNEIAIGVLSEIIKIDCLTTDTKFKCYQLIQEKMKNEVHWFNLQTRIKFISQEEPAKIITNESDGTVATICFNRNLILQNLDYLSILNNFIYLFNFIDPYHRVVFISAPSYKKGSLIELLSARNNSRKDYFDSNPIWNYMFDMAVMETKIYSEFLKERNIYLEEIIHWFFEEYIKNVFYINNFHVNVSECQKVETYYGKLLVLIPEFESIFKQYDSYCKLGEVSKEYISFLNQYNTSYPESLTSSKIVYVKKSSLEKSNTLFEELFAECYANFLNGAPSLYEFLMTVRSPILLSKQLFESYSDFNLLFEAGILVSDNKRETVIDRQILRILFEIYSFGYVCKNFIDKHLQKKIASLVKIGFLDEYNSLLSEQEQDLYQYIFKNKFKNEPYGIRNLYMHGNPSRDVKLHEYHYYITLTMMIVLILKLRDDFCLKQEKKTKDNITAS